MVFTVFLQSCEQPSAEALLPARVLIEAEELTDEVLALPDVQIVDIRPEKNYTDGHLPHASWLWRPDFSDEGGMMFSRDELEKSLGRKGISSENYLVLYDDRGSCEAARLWWILKYYGFDKVKILNGGIERWKRRGKPVTAEVTPVVPTTFTLPEKEHPQWLATKEEVQKAGASGAFVLDTRTPREFSGSRQKKGALRAGHIPGAVLVNFVEACDFSAEGDKCFKPVEEIKTLYEKVGLTPDKPIIVYCHSGVRSAHTTFVLTELLGFENVKNYDGSWREWSADTTLAIEQDSVTLIFN